MIDLTEILKKYWGFDDFRPAQKQVVGSVMQGKDTLAILPTGGGKSLCFQVPALAKEGVCLVVSPLIALMQDQVNNLTKRGIKAVCLAGTMEFSEINRILTNGIYEAYQFLYLSPERLDNEFVQEKIKQMNISLIAIDEAHCISHWGKDFRPSYLNCKKLRIWFNDVPIIALTASATDQVKNDIIENLSLKNVNIIKTTLNRKNLAYWTTFCDDKEGRLKRVLSQSNGSSIVYVRNRALTMKIAQLLNYQGFSAGYFHGGMSVEEKSLQLSQWLLGENKIMVATNAFGMGIDKPDVRSVVHWELPASLEDYFQEAGRAGRDGEKALAILLYNENDIEKFKRNFHQNLISIEDLINIYRKLCNYFYIPLGEGEGEEHHFSFSEFITSYNLDSVKTLNAFDFLSRNEIIEFSQDFLRRTSLEFLVSADEIRKFLLKNTKYRELLHFFMRSFPLVYREKIEFQLEKVSNQISKTPQEILFMFETLKNLGIINFETKNQDVKILFLCPRDDERTIYPIKNHLEWYNSHKKEQTQSVLDFISLENECKIKFLLNYFNEKQEENCGICSFCIKTKENRLNFEVFDQILNILKEKPLNFTEICHKISISEETILKKLDILIDEEKITINNFNEYILK